MNLTALDLLVVLLLLALTVAVLYALIRWLTLGIRDDLAEVLATAYADGQRADLYGPYWVVYGQEFKGPYHFRDTAERAQEQVATEHPDQGVHLVESIDVIEPRVTPTN